MIDCLVLDEADRMIADGHFKEMRLILAHIYTQRVKIKTKKPLSQIAPSFKVSDNVSVSDEDEKSDAEKSGSDDESLGSYGGYGDEELGEDELDEESGEAESEEEDEEADDSGPVTAGKMKEATKGDGFKTSKAMEGERKDIDLSKIKDLYDDDQICDDIDEDDDMVMPEDIAGNDKEKKKKTSSKDQEAIGNLRKRGV